MFPSCLCVPRIEQNASDLVSVGNLLTYFIRDGTKPYHPYDIRNGTIGRVYA